MKTKHLIPIRSVEEETHDVRHFIFDKPEGYSFTPGQATELTLLNEEEFADEGRPFSFTCLESDPYLEFFIKIYPDHEGVTEQLGKLEAGDEIELGEPFGAIAYEGPGVFIAGGAGVTPFIAIIRQLATERELHGHRLIFSNKTSKDIILEHEFSELLGDDAHFTLTREPASERYDNRRIDRDFLEEEIDDFDQCFYLCGPAAMVRDLEQTLTSLGADPDNLVMEDL